MDNTDTTTTASVVELSYRQKNLNHFKATFFESAYHISSNPLLTAIYVMLGLSIFCITYYFQGFGYIEAEFWIVAAVIAAFPIFNLLHRVLYRITRSGWMSDMDGALRELDIDIFNQELAYYDSDNVRIAMILYLGRHKDQSDALAEKARTVQNIATRKISQVEVAQILES